MGWCWRRCLSEEDGDGDGDDIGHYPLCWGGFFVILLGGEGLFFSRLSVGMVAMMIMMNGKHICPHKMVFFSFSSYIYLLCSEQIFFSFSPTQESYTCKDSLCWLCCCCCRR